MYPPVMMAFIPWPPPPPPLLPIIDSIILEYKDEKEEGPLCECVSRYSDHVTLT